MVDQRFRYDEPGTLSRPGLIGRVVRFVLGVFCLNVVLAILTQASLFLSGQGLEAGSVWLLYTFGHLGISFILAAALATPGCEMRAPWHLWTLMSGRRTQEHYCPGVLTPIDRWEARRRGAKPSG